MLLMDSLYKEDAPSEEALLVIDELEKSERSDCSESRSPSTKHERKSTLCGAMGEERPDDVGVEPNDPNGVRGRRRSGWWWWFGSNT